MSEDSPVMDIDVDAVRVDDETFQARTRYDSEKLDNLTEDMEKFGQRNPIGVRPHPDSRSGNDTDEYQLIYGFHRAKAARRLEWETITATIYGDVSTGQALELSIRDNTMHHDLHDVEKATQAAKLKNEGWSVDELCDVYNVGKSAIYNWLAVADLEPELLGLIAHDYLSLSHGVQLAKIDDEDRRLYFAEFTVKHRIAVKQLKEFRETGTGPTVYLYTNGWVPMCPLDLKIKSPTKHCDDCEYFGGVEDGGIACGGFSGADNPDIIDEFIQTVYERRDEKRAEGENPDLECLGGGR